MQGIKSLLESVYIPIYNLIVNQNSELCVIVNITYCFHKSNYI